MTLHVNPDWWKTLFDEFYLVTDARTVCNDETTRREIDVFGRLLPMAPGDRVLDLTDEDDFEAVTISDLCDDDWVIECR